MGDSEILSLNIHELDLESIMPNTENFDNKDQGGSKIVVIGKPGTGKTTLITDLLYYKNIYIQLRLLLVELKTVMDIILIFSQNLLFTIN